MNKQKKKPRENSGAPIVNQNERSHVSEWDSLTGRERGTDFFTMGRRAVIPQEGK